MKYTRDFRKLKLQKLADPTIAKGYLKEAAKTPELLLKAIGNVLQAHAIATVAKETGLARENLYRAFSDQGNPRYQTLSGVLAALGLRIDIAEIGDNTAQPSPPTLGLIREGKNEASIGVSGETSNAIA
jgi:probable addiction module antidote protein